MTSYLKPTVLRHIPKCLIKYRTRFPEIAFEPLYNLFVPLLQATAIEPRHVVDALRDDFLDEITRLGYDKLLGQTYYTAR